MSEWDVSFPLFPHPSPFNATIYIHLQQNTLVSLMDKPIARSRLALDWARLEQNLNIIGLEIKSMGYGSSSALNAMEVSHLLCVCLSFPSCKIGMISAPSTSYKVSWESNHIHTMFKRNNRGLLVSPKHIQGLILFIRIYHLVFVILSSNKYSLSC